MMYNVNCAIARGATLFTGRTISKTVEADGPLAAATRAEDLINVTLDDVEYAHARTVKPVGLRAVLTPAVTLPVFNPDAPPGAVPMPVAA